MTTRMGEPARKTYYQLSFTGSQGLAAVLAVLAGLAVAFFLGVRAGLTRPPGESVAEHAATEESAGEKSPPATPIPLPATSAAAAAVSAPSGASGPSGPMEAPVFEDREAALPLSNSTTSSPSRTVIAAGPEKSGAGESPAPQVVTPAPKPAAAKAAGFAVQIVSTSAKSEATRWKDRLAKRGYRVSIVRVDTSKGERFRVRVGPYADREKAGRMLTQLATEEHVKGWIVPAE